MIGACCRLPWQAVTTSADPPVRTPDEREARILAHIAVVSRELKSLADGRFYDGRKPGGGCIPRFNRAKIAALMERYAGDRARVARAARADEYKLTRFMRTHGILQKWPLRPINGNGKVNGKCHNGQAHPVAALKRSCSTVKPTSYSPKSSKRRG